MRIAEASGTQISCGSLMVMEDRESPAESRVLQLFVARLRAGQPSGNAPIVYLEGGPGGAASQAIAQLSGSALAKDYDIIVIDQRGSGLSMPSLNCLEADDPRADGRLWLSACYARLLAEGAALHAYTSAENARDIHELLRTLDIADAYIYGMSYGSRLALTLARDYPQRIRSMILDGVYPPQVNSLESQGPHAHRALEQLFSDCASQPDCQDAYPRLRGDFTATARRLNAVPAEIEQGDFWLKISGDDFVKEILSLLDDAAAIPVLPALIDAYARDDYAHDPQSLAQALQGEADVTAGLELDAADRYDDDSEGAYLSVECADEVHFNDVDEIERLSAGLPAAIRTPLTRAALESYDDCQRWPVPPAAPLENAPVASAIPTLLLSGQYDPLTPPAWGEEAARHLAISWHFVFPQLSHGALFGHSCPAAIALAFLAAPQSEPAASCLEALRPPDFAIAEKSRN